MDVDERLHFLWNLCLNGLFRLTLLFTQVHRCVTKSDSLQPLTMVTWIKTVISDNLQPSLISAKVCWLNMGYVKLKKKNNKIARGWRCRGETCTGTNNFIEDQMIILHILHKLKTKLILIWGFFGLFVFQLLHSGHWLYVCAAAGVVDSR